MTGELIAFGAVFTFVLSNVLFRKIDQDCSPIFINTIRTLIGTLSYFIISIILFVLPQIFLLSWEIWVFLILSFIFGQVIGDTAYFNAQKRLGAIKTLAISMTYPFFTLIFSYFFLERHLSLNMLFSAILIGIGTILIGKFKKQGEEKELFDKDRQNLRRNTLQNTDNTENSTTKFVLIGFIASIFWAMGIVLLDYSLSEINQILDDKVCSLIGNVIRFPFAFFILVLMNFRKDNIVTQKPPELTKNSKIWTYLIMGSIIGTTIGAALYSEAVRVAGAPMMSLIASAAPLFAIPLSYVINRETISKIGFIGIILIVIGVIIIVV
ncbi:MAG: DMT family transporter [Promethearchaeota archaeon]